MRRGLVLVGLVLIGVGLGLYFSFSRTQVARALGHGQPVHLLWILRLLPSAPPDLAVSVSLLPRGEVAFLLVPGRLSVPKGKGWSTLSAVYTEEGTRGWGERISGLLGAPFLLVQEVGPETWDEVVEAAGGVVVRPSERLFHQDPNRALSLDFPPGEQLLVRQSAREFLVYAWRYAEDPRFTLGLEFFRDFVPRFWARRKAGLSALRMDNTWETRDFWQRALSLPEEKVQVEVLPVVEEDSRLMPDFVGIRKLWAQVTTGRQFLTRDEVRMVVLNGTRERFLATRTANWLSARGFQVVRVGSADRSDYAKTFLIVAPGAEEKAELVRPLLPKETMVTTPQAFGVEKLGGWPQGADLVLIVGAGLDLGS